MRILVPLLALVCLLPGCLPSAPASAQARCRVDAECVLVDNCGCSCHAALGPRVPEAACSEVCGGHPCEGHRAVCRNGACVMQ